MKIYVSMCLCIHSAAFIPTQVLDAPQPLRRIDWQSKDSIIFSRSSSTIQGQKQRNNHLYYLSSSRRHSNLNYYIINRYLPDVNSIYVVLGLLVTVMGGNVVENAFQLGGIGAAPVFSMLLASLWSNSSMKCRLPSVHPIYVKCWSTLLPLSLSLILLAPNIEQLDSSVSRDVTFEHNDNNDYVLFHLGIPFLLGSLSSIIGCVAAFLLSTVIAKKCSILSFATLPLRDALLSTGCILSSYIGGSVNFFATATVLQTRLGIESASILSSLATVDLFLMAIYFAMLSMCHSSKGLHKIFKFETRNKNEDTPYVNQGNERLISISEKKQSLKERITVSMLLGAYTSLAMLIVYIGNMIQILTLIPGINCLLITGMSSVVYKVSRKFHFSSIKKIARVLSMFSNALFSILYASVGASATFADTLRTGPACLTFGFISLLCHAVCIGILSFLYNISISKIATSKLRQITLPEVLIASNCNIGGSVTAAAFAGSITRNRSLIIAATIWGCVGYAIGTTTGVYLTYILHQFLS